MWIKNQSGRLINLAQAYEINIKQGTSATTSNVEWYVDVYFPSPNTGFCADADEDCYSIWVQTFETRQKAEEYIDKLYAMLNKEEIA